MRYAPILALVPALALAAGTTHAQGHDPASHAQHMAALREDVRQQAQFPPPLREQTLANMRDHLQALAEILTALSAERPAEAAEIARTRLGLDAPSAACRSETAADDPQMSRLDTVDHPAARFMPEDMRRLGQEMHAAASVFATEAARAGETGNAKAAMAALADVTRRCVACHSAYRF